MKRRVLVACVAQVLLSASAFAAPADPFAHPVTDESQLHAALSRPAAKLANARVLEGKFRHNKHLAEIPRPLVATGEFTFVRDLGVYWHTQQPFDSVVVLTGAELVQSEGGAPGMRVTAGDQPAVRIIANIFMALFTLDVPALTRDFTVYGGKQGDGWVIGLKPRNAAIAAVFAQATVAGSDDVEQVVLTDSRGDRTVIDLSAISYSSVQPGVDLRALFAPTRP